MLAILTKKNCLLFLKPFAGATISYSDTGSSNAHYAYSSSFLSQLQELSQPGLDTDFGRLVFITGTLENRLAGKTRQEPSF